MSLRLQTLLIWLLMLALPAQAAAAQTMAFCGPQHTHAAVAAKPHSAAPASPVHGKGGEASSLAQHSHPDAARAGGELAGAGDASETSPAGMHKCSVCAACCSANAIAQAPLTVPCAAAGRAAFAETANSVGTLALAGPERPPRSRFA